MKDMVGLRTAQGGGLADLDPVHRPARGTTGHCLPTLPLHFFQSGRQESNTVQKTNPVVCIHRSP